MSLLGALVTVLAATAVADARVVAELILHASQLEGKGKITRETWTAWSDQFHQQAKTINYDSRGNVVGQIVVSIKGDRIRTDNAFYPAKQWVTRTYPFPPTAHGGGVTNSEYFPVRIREHVRAHLIGVIGRQTINGKKTLHLQGQTGSVLLQVWVEPTTYLAVKAVVRFGTTVQRWRFDWLLPTRANQAKMKLIVPPGFQHLG